MRLVIFDLDGTIIDSQAGIVCRMSACLEAYDIAAPSAELICSVIGLPLIQMYERVAPDAGLPTWRSMVERHTRMSHNRRARGEAPEPLYPGARDALTALDQAGMQLAISTSKSRAGADYALKGHGLDALFVKVRCPDDGHMKPHPDAVHDILAKTGVEARHTLFVGDTETDMMTAANAGVKVLGVSWGYHSVDMLLNAGAAGIAWEFGEVPALVKELIGT